MCKTGGLANEIRRLPGPAVLLAAAESTAAKRLKESLKHRIYLMADGGMQKGSHFDLRLPSPIFGLTVKTRNCGLADVKTLYEEYQNY